MASDTGCGFWDMAGPPQPGVYAPGSGPGTLAEPGGPVPRSIQGNPRGDRAGPIGAYLTGGGR